MHAVNIMNFVGGDNNNRGRGRGRGSFNNFCDFPNDEMMMMGPGPDMGPGPGFDSDFFPGPDGFFGPCGPGPFRGRGGFMGPGPRMMGPMGPMGPGPGMMGPMGPMGPRPGMMGPMGPGPNMMGPMGPDMMGPMGPDGFRGRGRGRGFGRGGRGRGRGGNFLYNCEAPPADFGGFGDFNDHGPFPDDSFIDPEPGDYNPMMLLAGARGRGQAPRGRGGRGGKVASAGEVEAAGKGEEGKVAEGNEDLPDVENPILNQGGPEEFEEFKKGWGEKFANQKNETDDSSGVASELKKFRNNAEFSFGRGQPFMRARGGFRGGFRGRGGKQHINAKAVRKFFEEEPEPVEPPEPPEPTHSEAVLDKFFKSVLRQQNPTAWVTETCKQKRWFVHSVESSKGPLTRRTFFHTVTVNEFKAVGKGPKKKEAKAEAFKKIAIKLGEYLCYLPLLPKPEIPKEETKCVTNKQTDAPPVSAVTEPVTVTTEAGMKVINTILESKSPKVINPLATLTAADDLRNIPDRIRIFNSHEMSSIEGHPVITLTDICKKLRYNMPQYACVKEEKVGKVGIYWKIEYTTRVAVAKGQEMKVYYGQSYTKKESKNQAAAAAYFGITGLLKVLAPEQSKSTSTSNLTKLVKSTSKIQDSIYKEIAQHKAKSQEGSKIAVLGSAVPLPAPSIMGVSQQPVPAQINDPILAPAQYPQTKTSSSLTEKMNSIVSSEKATGGGTEGNKEPGEIPEEGPSTSSKTTASSNPKSDSKASKPESSNSRSDSKKKGGDLDECLNEFETFLGDLESDVKKKKKKKDKSRSRSRSRHRSSRRSPSYERSSSRRRSDRSRSRDRERRSSYYDDRRGGYEDRRDSRDYDDRSRSYSRKRSRSRSEEKYRTGSRYYDDYYDDYDRDRRKEDRRRDYY